VTVQQAIDRLAANGHGGCDTITITPGSDWVAALEGLVAGSDATICFQPGEYTTSRPVAIAGLRHVRVAGGGPGTRLLGDGTEAVLSFAGCTTVTVRDLAAEVRSFPQDPVAGLLGVITVVGAAHVQAERLNLACPDHASARASCLTVRTGGESLDDAVADSVRVRDCDFTVGHGQSGVIVINSRRVVVSGSQFTTRQTGGVDLSLLFADRFRLSRAVDQLAGKLVVDRQQRVERGDFNTTLRVRDFVVRLNSPVPQQEWQALLAANPPSDTDVADATSVSAFFDRLVDDTVSTPSRLPTFGRQVTGLRGRLGSGAENFLLSAEGRTSVRALLSGTAIDVKPAAEVAAVQRAVNLPAEGGVVRFESPLSQNQWEAAFAAAAPSDRSPSGVAKHVRSVLSRALRDSAFANQVLPGFLDGLRQRNPQVAACGIRIGGHTVGEVIVERNRMSATAEGVHIGASFRRGPGQPVRFAESVRIESNSFELRVPVELARASRAVFVGNVGRAAVRDNVVSIVDGRALAGVHIEGRLGGHVVVRDNALSNCDIGVVIADHTPPLPFNPRRLWLVADNFAPGAEPAVAAPTFTRIEGNVS
jgi:hypothetical protein